MCSYEIRCMAGAYYVYENGVRPIARFEEQEHAHIAAEAFKQFDADNGILIKELDK